MSNISSPMLSLHLFFIIRAATDIDYSEVAAWSPMSDRALTCPFEVLMQISVLCVIAVTKRGVQFQAVILFAHGMIRASDNIKPGYGWVYLLGHPVFKSRLRAEIPQRVLHHPCRISVIVACNVLVPRRRSEHDLADLIKESSDYICSVLRRHTMSQKRLVYSDRRKDVCPGMLLCAFGRSLFSFVSF